MEEEETLEDIAAAWIRAYWRKAVSSARLAIFQARGQTRGTLYHELVREDLKIEGENVAAEKRFVDALSEETMRTLRDKEES